MPIRPYARSLLLLTSLGVVLGGCTLKVAAPDKPITINLNVKIEHEVRIKVEKDLDNLFEQKDSLF
jgi:hypothetical protein